MSDSPRKYGSDEYSATPDHVLPAISRNGKGYICQKCGHLEVTLDNNMFDDLCPKCVITALDALHVPRMIQVSEYFTDHDEALEPTVRVDKPNSEKTTAIIRKK